MDRLKPCPPFDPTKLPKMEILPKDRSLNNILFQSAAQEARNERNKADKKEPVKEIKNVARDYEGLLLQTMGNATKLFHSSPSTIPYTITNIKSKDPNDIEYLYNIKSLLYGVMQYLIAQRAILVTLLYRVNPDALYKGANGLQNSVLVNFANETYGYISDFLLLCMHIDIPLTYVEYAKIPIPNNNFKNLITFFKEGKYRQFTWKHPTFSHEIDDDKQRAQQIDNAFKYKRPFRLREPYTYDSVALQPFSGDYHYAKRYLNGCDTSYNYQQVMLKKANQIVAPVAAIPKGTYDELLTQFQTLQDIVYLHRPIGEKKIYEPILLNCRQEDPPPQLRLLEYIAKEQRMIEKLRSELHTYCRAILRCIHTASASDIATLNAAIHDDFKDIVRVENNTTISLTDYSTWMMMKLSGARPSPVPQNIPGVSAIPSVSGGYTAPRSGGRQKCLLP